MKKNIFLIDISSFIFRAYYAVRPLKAPDGTPTNAVYGVITMMLKLLKSAKPDALIVAYDSKGPSFRKDIYPEYKANREAPPEDLIPQFDLIKEFVSLYPFSAVSVPGYEADDIIATLVSRYKNGENILHGQEVVDKKHYDLIVVTGDKDLMQLVGDGVVIYDSMKDKTYDVADVREKFGVSPTQVLDVLALMGDASDNIPGVPGVGDKTATKLVSEWGSIDNLYENVDKIAGKIGEKLKANKADAYLSKKLAALEYKVPIDEKSVAIHAFQNVNSEGLREFYARMGFKSLAGNQNSAQVSVAQPSQTNKPSETILKKYELILTETDLLKWVEKIKTAKKFAFDTETTGINPFRDRLVGISLAVNAGEACYIPLYHSYLGCETQLPLDCVIKNLQPLFEDETIAKYAQNARFDSEILLQAGFKKIAVTGDSLLASYLMDPEGRHSLDYLAKEHFAHDMIAFESVVSKGDTFDHVELAKACEYSAEDADYTLRLVEKLNPLLTENKLWDCYSRIEMPLVPVLVRIETNGVNVDRQQLKALSKEFGERLQILEQEIYQHAGTTFNVNSPKQLGEILFVKLNLPTQKKTKTGFSTDVEVLNELAALHPLPKVLLEYRTLSKLNSTYVEQLMELINPITGRIHTSYNQTVAATGRLSSSDPNLQNIPIRSEEGRRIRTAFAAGAGKKILSADYSQIELRLLAAFSKDPELVDAFLKDKDIHRLTGEKLFNQTEITSDQRARAKTVNFGILYGQSPFGLSSLLNIPQSEAKGYIDQFYAQFPSVKAYKEKVLSEAAQTGEVRTWMGRRRLLPDLNSKNGNLRANAERVAFNTVFQGSAADLIKLAMINVQKKLDQKKWDALMIMQVHDELVFEVADAHVEELTKLVRFEMENAIPCEVPLKVDVGVGSNWTEAK